MINPENVIDKKYVEVQEHGEQESLFLIKPFELFLSYGVDLLTVHLLTKLFSRQLWNEQDWKINLLSIDVKDTKEPIMHKETCAFL